MDSEDGGLLGGVDHEEFRMRSGEQSSAKTVPLAGVFVNVQLVFVQIENQLERAVRQKPFLRVRLGVALVIPELIDEIRQRRRGNVAAKPTQTMTAEF